MSTCFLFGRERNGNESQILMFDATFKINHSRGDGMSSKEGVKSSTSDEVSQVWGEKVSVGTSHRTIPTYRLKPGPEASQSCRGRWINESQRIPSRSCRSPTIGLGVDASGPRLPGLPDIT